MGLLFDDVDFMLIAAELFEAVEQENADANKKFRFDLNSISPDECWSMFRFQKKHILLLKQLLRIPDQIHLNNRSVFSGVDALCITLRRLAYPCRLTDLVNTFWTF